MEQGRINKLKVRYGLTPETYQNMIDQQNNQCDICKVDFTKVDKIHTDHCHKSGKVRGLLCINCNSGIGIFRDDPIVLKKAIEYLEKHSV